MKFRSLRNALVLLVAAFALAGPVHAQHRGGGWYGGNAWHGGYCWGGGYGWRGGGYWRGGWGWGWPGIYIAPAPSYYYGYAPPPYYPYAYVPPPAYYGY